MATDTLETFEHEEIETRAAYLDNASREIKRLWEIKEQAKWDMGKLLAETKQRYPRQWLAWVSEHLPFKHDTATRYMSLLDLPRPVVETVNLTTAYALAKAPKIVQGDATAYGINNADVVKLMTSLFRHADEDDEYDLMMIVGGWTNTHDEFIALSEATPADVREYRAAKQAARFVTYEVRGTIERVADTLVIRGADIPSDLVDGRVNVKISREIE